MKKSPKKSGTANKLPFLRRVISITGTGLLVLGALLVGLFAGARYTTALPLVGEEVAEAGEINSSEDASENTSASDSEAESLTEPETVSPLHPGFTLGASDFQELVRQGVSSMNSAAPEETREQIYEHIVSEPAIFLQYLQGMLNSPDPMLYALADKRHSLSSDYVPSDLVSLNEYQSTLVLNRNDLSLRSSIMPMVLAMVEAARLDGITLDFSSSYRSYEYQEGLFQRHVDNLGLEEAERVSARPGTSQHQLGTTMDFGSVTPAFAVHPAGLWLAEHAGDFGFSLSYPDGYEEITGYSYEPWHFRYIGDAAVSLQDRYFQGIQQYLLEFYHYTHEEFRTRLLP
ncbi:M15 family metallopeptidase [Salinispira pacifica]|nr:M15 family metallopeptidase [Salinispira pacifica]